MAFIAQVFRTGDHPIGEDDVLRALDELCEGRRSFAELAPRSVEGLVEYFAADSVRKTSLLGRWRLSEYQSQGDVCVPVQYEVGRCRDSIGGCRIFGEGRARVAGGRWCSAASAGANQRPVQVTTDLAAFGEDNIRRCGGS